MNTKFTNNISTLLNNGVSYLKNDNVKKKVRTCCLSMHMVSIKVILNIYNMSSSHVIWLTKNMALILIHGCHITLRKNILINLNVFMLLIS